MPEITINQCVTDFEDHGIERPCGDGEVIANEANTPETIRLGME